MEGSPRGDDFRFLSKPLEPPSWPNRANSHSDPWLALGWFALGCTAILHPGHDGRSRIGPQIDRPVKLLTCWPELAAPWLPGLSVAEAIAQTRDRL